MPRTPGILSEESPMSAFMSIARRIYAEIDLNAQCVVFYCPICRNIFENRSVAHKLVGVAVAGDQHA